MLQVFDKEFKKYGEVLDLKLKDIMDTFVNTSHKPEDCTVYVASDPVLKAMPEAAQIRRIGFGDMEIEIGYCNGFCTKLNALEFHRGSELIIPADDIVLMLGHFSDIEDGKLDTATVQYFTVPAGTPVRLYETSLHYSPMHRDHSFRAMIVLPRGTNEPLEEAEPNTGKGPQLVAKNKWLLAHAESSEAKSGCYVGLTGINPDLRELSL